MIGKKFGSIYSLMDDGLTVRDGRLINNRPDGKNGIEKAAELRKSIKRAEKISMISEGVALGNMKEDMMQEGMGMMMTFKGRKS
jgi:hypothetical protein